MTDQVQAESPVVDLLTRMRAQEAAGEPAVTDPVLAVASALLQQRRLADQPDEDDEHLQHSIDELEATVRVLRRRNLRLASALGACPECWGGDQACQRCAGAGGPGAYPPNPSWFDRLVAPCLRWHQTNDHLRNETRSDT